MSLHYGDFEVPRHPKKDGMGLRVVPSGKLKYIGQLDFFDLDGTEGAANNCRKPTIFKRLFLGGTVRLQYAYVIQRNDIKYDPETNEPIELMCTVFPYFSRR